MAELCRTISKLSHQISNLVLKCFTIRDMKNYLTQRLFLTISLLCLSAISAIAQTTDKSESSAILIGKANAPVTTKAPETPTPQLNALRTAKYIFVKSSSLVVGISVIEEKLQKRREFQSMGLIITRDPYTADIVLEVHHDIFTKYVYSAVDRKNNIVVAGGKLSSLGGTVAGKVSERFLKQMLRARQS
jgi:hypothetical protein